MLQRDEANKQETSTSTATIAKPSPWSLSRSKDHRIVRVSRAFGGKDRHSKVCTVRGLRDRRVRLSVPTAIQLYDLQDRLGLNQPSKVVDWLLDAAKHEIDELPPLQFLPSMMALQDFATYQQQSAKQGSLLINRDESNGYDDSFIRPPSSSSWDHHQQSISLGLTAHDQNLDLHNLGFLHSGPSGLLLSSSLPSDQVLGYQHHHHQAEMSNTTQPYFPHTNRDDEP